MLDLVMKLLWRLIIHAGLKLGACSTCRAHKIRCEVAPGATICKRCERSGQGAACILGASRTRSTRSSSTPPADSQIVHPVPVHGRKRSNSTRSCSERSSGVHQPTKKKRSLKSQGGMEAVVACSNLQSLDRINEDENEFMASLSSALGQLIILIKPASPLMQISVMNGPAFFLEDLSTPVKMRMILIAWTRTLNALISTLPIAVMKNFQTLHLRLGAMPHRPSIILDS